VGRHSSGVAGISRADRVDSRKKEYDMPDRNPKSKQFACGQIVPDCAFTADAATEEELLQHVAAHAAHDHGITELTPDLVERVKSAIKTL
jgi:predicted small metal-binding protein